MKLAKLSLAALVALGTSAFAADSLEGAFKEAKVSGALKAYYMDSERDNAQDTDAFAVGGLLKFETADYMGFKAGFEFQTSHTLGLEDEDPAKNDGSVAIQETMLSEAYLAYTVSKTTFKVGRMHIGTPLVSDSGSRLLRDYFTGGVIVSNEIENVTLIAGAVTEWTKRTNVVVDPEDPIYTVYAAGNLGPVALTAQMTTIDDVTAAGNDGREDYYLDAEVTLGSGMPVTLGAQYIAIDDEAADYDSYLFGLKAELAVAGFDLGVYYNTTDDEGPVTGGWGHGNDPSYNSVQVESGNSADTDSIQGRIGYDFAKAGVPGLTAFTRYVDYDRGAANNDGSEWDIDATYKFSGALKGLTTQIRYAMVEYDASNDVDNFRFIVNYNF